MLHRSHQSDRNLLFQGGVGRGTGIGERGGLLSTKRGQASFIARPGFDQLFLRDAIERIAAAQEESPARHRRRGVDAVVEPVGRERFNFVRLLDDDRRAVASGEIDAGD